MPGKIGKLLYWQGPSTQSLSIIFTNETPVHNLRLAESMFAFIPGSTKGGSDNQKGLVCCYGPAAGLASRSSSAVLC